MGSIVQAIRVENKSLTQIKTPANALASEIIGIEKRYGAVLQDRVFADQDHVSRGPALYPINHKEVGLKRTLRLKHQHALRVLNHPRWSNMD